MDSSSTDPQPLFVACLCAAWCRICDDYLATFEALTAEFGAQIQSAWIDIEDHADTLDELDIETFPTLMVSRGDDLLFLGPVLPSPHSARQVMQRALAGKLGALRRPDLDDMPERLRASVSQKRVSGG
jgi:thioredoxin 1